MYFKFTYLVRLSFVILDFLKLLILALCNKTIFLFLIYTGRASSSCSGEFSRIVCAIPRVWTSEIYCMFFLLFYNLLYSILYKFAPYEFNFCAKAIFVCKPSSFVRK